MHRDNARRVVSWAILTHNRNKRAHTFTCNQNVCAVMQGTREHTLSLSVAVVRPGLGSLSQPHSHATNPNVPPAGTQQVCPTRPPAALHTNERAQHLQHRRSLLYSNFVVERPEAECQLKQHTCVCPCVRACVGVCVCVTRRSFFFFV